MEVANSRDGLKFKKAEQLAELFVGSEGDLVVKIDEKGLVAGALEARVGGGSGHAVGLYRPRTPPPKACLPLSKRERKLEGLFSEWNAQDELAGILATLEPHRAGDLIARSDCG